MFEKFYPEFVDMVMSLDFPAFFVHEKTPLKVVFTEVERGDDVSERFVRLRGCFMEIMDSSRSRLDISLFFSPNRAEPLYSKEINIVVDSLARWGVTKIRINIPRTNRLLNVVIKDDSVHIENHDGSCHIFDFERVDDAVKYVRNFISEQVQIMSTSSTKEGAVAQD